MAELKIQTNYTEDDIRSLDWKEHIRLRPGMYIGKLDDEPTVGRVYFEADCETMTARDVIPHGFVDDLIEIVDERLYDDIGECAYDVLGGVTPEANLELDAFLLAWVEKNSDISRYWKIVGKSRECQITEGDLE